LLQNEQIKRLTGIGRVHIVIDSTKRLLMVEF
jgi:hypothetical protein